MYNDKITALQSVIIPATSKKYAKEKLTIETKRRLGPCEVLIYSTNVFVAENERFEITL